jgi:hypothetical protein
MQILLMKKILLILALIILGLKSQAQLEKGVEMGGIQLPLIVNDSYFTQLKFGSSPTKKDFGISIVPTYAFVIDHNWLLGVQATVGIETISYSNSISGFSTLSKETYTDLGIAPFTRYYVDLSKNKQIKIFGVAALEINTANSKYTYTNGTSNGGGSFTTTNGSIGGGLAWFGKKVSGDLSMSTTALRFGIYRLFPGGKK